MSGNQIIYKEFANINFLSKYMVEMYVILV